jgi:tetratricopeptide (TPR) repeat protein
MRRLCVSVAVCLLFFSGGLRAESEAAEALLKNGQFDAACPLIEAALRQEPTSDRLKMGLVRCLLMRRESADYVVDLRRALRMLEESIRIYEGIPGQEKALAWRHFYAGMALWYLNQSELALAAFDRALRLNATFHQALYNSITILDELGRYEEARLRKQTYIRIATIDPF